MALVDEAVDAGGLGRQVVKDFTICFMPYHQGAELALEQLGKLGAGAVDGFFAFFVLAADDRPPPRLQAGSGGVADYGV